MDEINESESVSCVDKESVYKRIVFEEAEYLEEAWKERMELMEAESKSHFTNILSRLPNLGQLI